MCIFVHVNIQGGALELEPNIIKGSNSRATKHRSAFELEPPLKLTTVTHFQYFSNGFQSFTQTSNWNASYKTPVFYQSNSDLGRALELEPPKVTTVTQIIDVFLL